VASRREIERSVAAKALKQHGVIARDQLLARDVTRHTIQRWLDGKRLRQVHRGVYAVGAQPLTQIGHWYAALLAARPDPLLSHISSLAKMGLARERVGIHVTVIHRKGRNLRGVTVHRCRSIDPDDRTRIDGLPLTTLPRTLIDVAETEGAAFVAKVLEEADRRKVLDPAAIHACAKRNPGRRGLAVLLPLVDDYVPTPNAKEGLERDFQLFLRDRDLPLPEVNVLVHGHLVDCWWPEAQVVVELDSRKWHEHWDARERDLARDSTLQRHGVRAIRVTDRRLKGGPDELEADLTSLLRAPGATHGFR
jgi:very-short-patch-repair endonuclease